MEIYVAAKAQGLLMCQIPWKYLRNGHKVLRASFPQMVVDQQSKYMYSNAHSMGNTQEELEAFAQCKNHDIVTMMEAWWEDLYQSAVNSSEQIGKEGEAVKQPPTLGHVLIVQVLIMVTRGLTVYG